MRGPHFLSCGLSTRRIEHNELRLPVALNGLVPRRDHWAGLAATNRGLRRLAVILQSKDIQSDSLANTFINRWTFITIVIITSNSITITIAIHWRLAMFLQRHPQIKTKYVRRCQKGGFKPELIHSLNSSRTLKEATAVDPLRSWQSNRKATGRLRKARKAHELSASCQQCFACLGTWDFQPIRWQKCMVMCRTAATAADFSLLSKHD